MVYIRHFDKTKTANGIGPKLQIEVEKLCFAFETFCIFVVSAFVEVYRTNHRLRHSLQIMCAHTQHNTHTHKCVRSSSLVPISQYQNAHKTHTHTARIQRKTTTAADAWVSRDMTWSSSSSRRRNGRTPRHARLARLFERALLRCCCWIVTRSRVPRRWPSSVVVVVVCDVRPREASD